MPFIPHTDEDIQAMLAVIGASSVEQLFDEIPPHLCEPSLKTLPAGLTEMEVGQLMRTFAKQDVTQLSFIGAGAYEHHIPAAVWDITTRGEFMTAYTPYQAEASQGTLQLLYEYQTMMASLMGMDVSNASLYDGASALAEAVLMAVRANRNVTAKRILVPLSLHPYYRQVLKTVVTHQGIELIDLPYDLKTGKIDISQLTMFSHDPITALIIPQPNFLGVLEAVDELTRWAHAHKALAIACVNPLAMSVLKEPGQWGEQGADIVCGEGQPLGIPLASGGPYFGFMACKQAFVRQMPGRIVGRTVDQAGKIGFTLTLQAREQHIRRSKATSNICTNQGLLVTAATIHMSLLGFEGLQRAAMQCAKNTARLAELLEKIPGVSIVFSSPRFHEMVVRFDRPVAQLLDKMAEAGIQGGYALQSHHPELGNCLLICVTETKTDDDLRRYAHVVEELICQP